MSIVTSIFETLAEIAESFGTLLVSLFDNVVQLFWTPAAEGTGGELTVLGVFLLIGMATGLFIWAFNYIKRLIGGISTRGR